MTSTPALADLFAHVAGTLVDDFDVVDLLHDLTLRAVEVGGARCAGLVLLDQRGTQQLMAASDSVATELVRLQLHHQEGPALACLHERRESVDLDLRQEQRWESFTPAALEHGITRAHAFPMRLRETMLGALTLYAAGDEPITPETARLVQALADVATVAIVHERAVRQAEVLAEQLQSALNARVAVEQARGAVARLAQVDVDASFDILRRRAHLTQTRLVDVAHQVLGGSYEHIPGVDG